MPCAIWMHSCCRWKPIKWQSLCDTDETKSVHHFYTKSYPNWIVGDSTGISTFFSNIKDYKLLVKLKKRRNHLHQQSFEYHCTYWQLTLLKTTALTRTGPVPPLLVVSCQGQRSKITFLPIPLYQDREGAGEGRGVLQWVLGFTCMCVAFKHHPEPEVKMPRFRDLLSTQSYLPSVYLSLPLITKDFKW